MSTRSAIVDATVFSEHKSQFTEFLQSPQGDGCRRWLSELKGGGDDDDKRQKRLLLSVNDLRKYDGALAQRVMHRPLDYLKAWEEATKQWMETQLVLKEKEDVTVGMVGNFGSRTMTPRELRSSHLGEHVCVLGIVTHCSLAVPKLLKSVHWDPQEEKYTSKEYRDATCIDAWIASNALRNSSKQASFAFGASSGGVEEPFYGGDALPLILKNRSFRRSADDKSTEQFGLGVYGDHQSVSLQELPEAAPLGQLPRSVDVIVEDDLVDSVRPGDRVFIAGVYKAVPSSGSGFRSVLVANSITPHQKATAEDIGYGINEPVQPIPMSTLMSWFAPSIHGLDMIKFALILQLVGGCEKIIESGSRLRGDINVLLLGDPSTAKSQLLRATMRAAPLAISTTGRGSSGVGLTAAVTQDKETGGMRLQAGATVLADRGIVCIDEFDKMATGDRVAIHEVMEQQTVTLAKAGIHASLNARCSILAAANPIYGQYDPSKRPQENIGLPDSLLSRFDLIFLVLDRIDATPDQTIADHVLRLHRDGSSSDVNRNGALTEALLRAADDEDVQTSSSTGGATHHDVAHLKRYIAYARNNIKPVLHLDARNALASGYADLRAKADERTLPVTARCLESLIRLATAHAKLRLSNDVTIADCNKAFDLVSAVLYGDNIKDIDQVVPDSETNDEVSSTPGETPAAPAPAVSTEAREAKVLGVLTKDPDLECITEADLLAQVNADRPPREAEFTLPEIYNILNGLEEKNLILHDKVNANVLRI